jgi:hypothetical protein
MNLVEVICIAVPSGLAIGAAVAIGVSKLLKRERKSLPFVGSVIVYDAEPYPRSWE